MPILKKASSKRRGRGGDFLALLLLIGLMGGLGWLWWHEKHPAKAVHKKSSAPARVVEKAKEQPKIQPKPVPLVFPARLTADFPRPVRDVFEAQIALARRAISPGSIDGAIGSQTRMAISIFQQMEKLPATGRLDTNTRPLLTLAAPVFTTYAVTTNDLARLQPLGKTWLEKSQQTALEYESVLELVAEKSHAHPEFIRRLNPDVNWTNVAAGTILQILDVDYPAPADKAAQVVIHLSGKFLEAFDAETNLLAHCPCSIAARVEKRPVGELHVAVVAPDPNYTFDPDVFPESQEAQAIGHKLILHPGPNNPVGVAWIGLDKTGYGIHGTPAPEQVGRTESHGCFRLANWDAEYLLKLARVGLPVEVVP
ncbi:MAG: L,D-transpeptidase [Verrucomicrobiales bacterium]|nr:L,D-transpeptidase [Verrucomicrobiales bacterium]